MKTGKRGAMKKRKIIIAGAGLGGLAAASCLMKAGHEVEVYEQAAKLGEIGAGIQISANAQHVLRDLGLGPAIDAAGVRPGAYVFRLHDTGEVIQEFPLAEQHERVNGAPYTQMHRADFHQILVDKACEFRPDVIRLNKRVRGYVENEDSVELHFEDGTVARGDILIGADGLKSVVRAQMFGAAPAVYTGDGAWRLVVPIENLPKDILPPVMSVFMGPGGHVVCYYLRSGKLLNFVGLVETDEISEESWTMRFPWERLKADYVGWHPVIQTIIDCANRDECYRWSLHRREPTMNWSTKRVTLLGDSAHPTLPYLAQGAVMSIEDGAVFTRALAMSDDIAEALQIYQESRAVPSRQPGGDPRRVRQAR
jgi:salicylate hydroxylase